MKLRLIDRIVLLISAAWMFASGLLLFAVAFTDWQQWFEMLEKLRNLLPGADTAIVVTAIVLSVLLSVYVLLRLVIFRRRRNNLVMQNSENGAIGIAVSVLEELVFKCVEKHEDICVSKVSMREERTGLSIRLNVSMAAGLNIPLAVGALQKQIRQYVTSCTGVDVTDVRVEVTHSQGEASVKSGYAVPEGQSLPQLEEPMLPVTPAPQVTLQQQPASAGAADAADLRTEAVQMQNDAPRHAAGDQPEVQAEEKPDADLTPEVSPVVEIPPITIPVSEIPEEEADRPLHQRLFSSEDQPAFVPEPPVMPPVPETAEASEQAEKTEQAPAADEAEDAHAETAPEAETAEPQKAADEQIPEQ